jgi:hypothetical protein
MKNYCILILWLMGLTSCFKEEIPVDAPIKNPNVLSNEVDLGSAYSIQAYFDLGTNTIVQIQNKDIWDLAFDCTSDNDIFQNTSISASAAITDISDFEAVSSSTPVMFTYDHHNGNTDSLALGRWFEHGKVVVIDRGYRLNGLPLGKLKFKVVSYDDMGYHFKYSKLNGSDYHEAYVPKESEYNTIGYSFTTHSIVYHEPKKNLYDLCFTSYIYIFYEPEYTPYSVVGVLTNTYQTESARNSSLIFGDITQEALNDLHWSTSRATIGYDWKSYDLDAGFYTTYSHINFVIKDSEDSYYKLHFTDYYNDAGERGCPNFDYQLLE